MTKTSLIVAFDGDHDDLVEKSLAILLSEDDDWISFYNQYVSTSTRQMLSILSLIILMLCELRNWLFCDSFLTHPSS